MTEITNFYTPTRLHTRFMVLLSYCFRACSCQCYNDLAQYIAILQLCWEIARILLEGQPVHSLHKAALIAMVAMAVLSLTNLFGLNAAGASVIVGIVFFFVNKRWEKPEVGQSGLEITAMKAGLQNKSLWIWLALPTIMDALVAGVSTLLLPEFIEYELMRVDTFVSLNHLALLVVQLAVLALGEEIAWRAFFQRQLSKVLPVLPVLLGSSLLFALGHWTVLPTGSTAVVIYSVFSVFINSLFYGVIFHKSQNAWLSGISHFIANLLSVLFLPFFA